MSVINTKFMFSNNHEDINYQTTTQKITFMK